MDYDILILGGGMIGCAVAYELSKYSLNIALIEKDYDIADDVALINSAVVYDGVESKDDITAKLELMGNSMFEEISSKFNVPFKRCGSFIVARNEEEEKKLENIYETAINRGIQDIALLNGKHIYDLEPNLNISVKKALYSKNTGIVCPYDMAIAYAEVAFDNGVNFKLEEEVRNIQKISKGYRVVTNKNKFTCKFVINTTPGINYSIDNSDKSIHNNINYSNCFLIDREFKGSFSNMISTISENDEKVYTTVSPVKCNNIITIDTKEKLSFEETLQKAQKLITGIDKDNIHTFYQSIFYKDVLILDDSLIDKGYVKITGKHYGEVTMTPSIAKMVCETVVANVKCKLKKDFIDKRREFYRFRNLSTEERNNIIKMDKSYGKIVCVCEMITEGEIIDAIRRPLGARTVEGIKRRTGATFGDCEGANCINKIVSILARETNKDITEIVKDSKDSKIVVGRIKEFNEM